MTEQIAAFDVGDRRVGVAFSDPFGGYAIPSDTYFRTGDFGRDVCALADIVRARGVRSVVVGLPLNEDGSESVQSEKTRRFAAALEGEELSVVLEDERYTTRAARGDLKEMGVSQRRDKRKKQVDSIAAAYILESYLAKNRQGEHIMKEERNDYTEDDNIVELVDDEGNSFRFEHLMTFEYKGQWYCALTELKEAAEEGGEDEEESEEVAIYRIEGDEDNEQLVQIEDDDELDEVFAEFCTQYEDFEDADEAARLDGADDPE